MNHLPSNLNKFLLPNLVKIYKGNKNVKIIYLVKIDEEKILQGLSKNKSKHDWLMGNTKNKDTIKQAAKSVSFYGKYYKKESKKYGFKCINTEDDFKDKINEAFKYLK